MSSLPRFFGEDSKWLPHCDCGEGLQRMCEGVWGGGGDSYPAPGPHRACEDSCNPFPYGSKPALVPYLCHISSLTYLFLQGRNRARFKPKAHH